MDKKSLIIGVALMLGAGALMFFQGRQQAKHAHEAGTASFEPITEVQKEDSTKQLEQPLYTTGKQPESIFESVTSNLANVAPSVEEKLFALENEYIKVYFTSNGGGIHSVGFKKYPLQLGSEKPFVFNANNPTPALSISFPNENNDLRLYNPVYKVAYQSNDRIVLTAITKQGVEILRGYSLSLDEKKVDPYVISHETRFQNKTKEPFNLKKLFISMGSFPPTKGDTLGDYLNVGYYDGKDAEFIKINRFHDTKGFFGIGKRQGVVEVFEPVKPLIWGSVKNQFFTSVLTPQEPGIGIYAKNIDLGDSTGETGLSEGITGSIELQLGQIAPAEERVMAMQFYVGPKEFTRLDALGKQQDKVMQFGIFGFVSKFLLILMNGIHKFIPNWGLTIIAVTVLIKLVLWPLTAVQVRSSKRMAKIQKPLQELKEKYKGSPQKIQSETLKLFKQHKVNPAAGCLPLLVQLPIFLGLYFMLRTSSELRFASFLWIPDLSLPDTVAYIYGFPVNILPVLMAGSMFLQMKITPTPTTDSMQQKIFQLMPVIFLFFCYSFPAGLVLYWTVQNLLTIVQQYISNKMKDPLEDLVVEETDKKLKNKRGKKSHGRP